jgi:protein-tyrosine-phosphatase
MHRSQLISQSEVFRADLVLVMDPDQARRLAISFGVAAGTIVIAPDLSTRFHGTRSIHDPWNQPIHVFASSFDHLDDCAETLIDIVRGTN